MKTMTVKYLLTTIVLCTSIHNSNAQNSIQLKNADTDIDLSPNEVISIEVDPETNAKVTFDVKNISNSTKSYIAKRYDVLLNANSTSTAQAYFCIAGSCYGPPTLVSPSPLTLLSQQSASELEGPYQMLIADLDEATTRGYSIIKYTFQNTDVAGDSVQVTINYNAPKTTNIMSQSDPTFDFEIAPNPSNESIRIKTIKIQDNPVVTIIDVLGNVIHKEQITKYQSEEGYKIDLTGYAAGIYHVSLKSQNSTAIKKIVVK